MRAMIASSDLIHVKMTNFLLEEVGFKATHQMNRSGVLHALRNEQVDLVLLDYTPGEFEGLAMCSEIRSHHQIPIIFVASAGAVDDRVRGLKAGADDYLGKPYNPNELLARIESVMRRYSDDFSNARLTYQALTVGSIYLDPVKRQVTVAGRDEENLTEREFQLLYYLMQNARCILSSRQLLQKIWGYDYEVQSNVVPVYIGRLRRKLERDPEVPQHIVRVRDLGYCFNP